jgi:hypothetical protein
MPADPTLVECGCDRRAPAVPATKAVAAIAEIIRIFMLKSQPVEADENFGVV